jgi:hypothetical protein
MALCLTAGPDVPSYGETGNPPGEGHDPGSALCVCDRNCERRSPDDSRSPANRGTATRPVGDRIHSGSCHDFRGDAWYEKKEYDKAISDYSEAIRLNPSDGFAYASRGAARRQTKVDDDAIKGTIHLPLRLKGTMNVS